MGKKAGRRRTPTHAKPPRPFNFRPRLNGKADDGTKSTALNGAFSPFVVEKTSSGDFLNLVLPGGDWAPVPSPMRPLPIPGSPSAASPVAEPAMTGDAQQTIDMGSLSNNNSAVVPDFILKMWEDSKRQTSQPSSPILPPPPPLAPPSPPNSPNRPIKTSPAKQQQKQHNKNQHKPPKGKQKGLQALQKGLVKKPIAVKKHHPVRIQDYTHHAPPPTALVEALRLEADALGQKLSQLTMSNPASPTARQDQSSDGEGIESSIAAMKSQINAIQSCIHNFQDLRLASAGVINDAAGKTFVCFDTNILVERIEIFEQCWKLLAKQSSSEDCCFLLMPLEVLRELDSLKGHTTNIFRPQYKATAARRAMRYLEQEIVSSPYYRGQKEKEQLYHGSRRHNDDGILYCLLLFQYHGARLIFVSLDRGLNVRAFTEGICLVPPEAILAHVKGIIDNKDTTTASGGDG